MLNGIEDKVLWLGEHVWNRCDIPGGGGGLSRSLSAVDMAVSMVYSGRYGGVTSRLWASGEFGAMYTVVP